MIITHLYLFCFRKFQVYLPIISFSSTKLIEEISFIIEIVYLL